MPLTHEAGPAQPFRAVHLTWAGIYRAHTFLHVPRAEWLHGRKAFCGHICLGRGEAKLGGFLVRQLSRSSDMRGVCCREGSDLTARLFLVQHICWDCSVERVFRAALELPHCSSTVPAHADPLTYLLLPP